jgi:hypothetical protein
VHLVDVTADSEAKTITWVDMARIPLDGSPIPTPAAALKAWVNAIARVPDQADACTITVTASCGLAALDRDQADAGVGEVRGAVERAHGFDVVAGEEAHVQQGGDGLVECRLPEGVGRTVVADRAGGGRGCDLVQAELEEAIGKGVGPTQVGAYSRGEQVFSGAGDLLEQRVWRGIDGPDGEILNDQPASWAHPADGPLEQFFALGQMAQQGSGVDEVERLGREVVGYGVVLEHTDRCRGREAQELSVGVGGGDLPVRAVIGQPGGDRSGSGAQFQAVGGGGVGRGG